MHEHDLFNLAELLGLFYEVSPMPNILMLWHLFLKSGVIECRRVSEWHIIFALCCMFFQEVFWVTSPFETSTTAQSLPNMYKRLKSLFPHTSSMIHSWNFQTLPSQRQQKSSECCQDLLKYTLFIVFLLCFQNSLCKDVYINLPHFLPFQSMSKSFLFIILINAKKIVINLVGN